MKAFKTLVLSLLIMATMIKGNAAANDKRPKLTIDYAIGTYVDAVCHGKIFDLDRLFDDHLKYSMVRNGETNVYNKGQIMDFFKEMQNIEQNCSVKTSTNDKTPDVVIEKVDMKYPTFTRTNYVTMVNSDEGWKITNVYVEIKKNGKK